MAKNRVLLVHAKIGDAPIGYRCSVCHRIFPVPGGSLTEQEKAAKVQATFDGHNCKEDASQAAAPIVREATED